MNIKIKLSIALVLSFLLVACGGGGGGAVKVWKLVKEVTTNGTDGSTSSIVTNTYENGLLAKKDMDEDANGQIDHFSDSYILYEYSDGILSKKTFYTASGRKTIDRLIDEQGRNTGGTAYDQNGGINSTFFFKNTYDDNKRIIKEEYSVDNDPVRRVIVFTYEGNIETHKYDTDMDGKTDDVTFILTHNDRGELIKKEIYNKNQELTSTYDYTYEYDENNNIQTKTALKNGNALNVITYTWE